MAVVALTAGKGAPGVTTSALALTWTWSRRVLLAECDPAGGSVMAGYLQGQVPADRGLMPLTVAALRSGQLTDRLWEHLVDLDPPHRRRLLLPGLSSASQAASLGPLWDGFAALFRSLEYVEPGYDVLVDCGRLGGDTPWPLLRAADLVALVVRPTLPSVSASVSAVAELHRHVTERSDPTPSLGLMVIGPGPYTTQELSAHLGAPTLVQIPRDSGTAVALGFGGSVRRARPLLTSAAAAESTLRTAIAAGRREVSAAAPRPALTAEVTTRGAV
jgi:hypothetical protein